MLKTAPVSSGIRGFRTNTCYLSKLECMLVICGCSEKNFNRPLCGFQYGLASHRESVDISKLIQKKAIENICTQVHISLALNSIKKQKTMICPL